MIHATELQSESIYRPSKSSTGMPNTYYRVVPAAKVKKLAARLSKKGYKAMSAQDVIALQAAQAAETGEGVLMEVFCRFLTLVGERKETRRYMGIPLHDKKGKPFACALREVQAKPGYQHSV